MWNLKVAPYPAEKELKNTIIDMKKGDQNELFKRYVSDR